VRRLAGSPDTQLLSWVLSDRGLSVRVSRGPASPHPLPTPSRPLVAPAYAAAAPRGDTPAASSALVLSRSVWEELLVVESAPGEVPAPAPRPPADSTRGLAAGGAAAMRQGLVALSWPSPSSPSSSPSARPSGRAEPSPDAPGSQRRRLLTDLPSSEGSWLVGEVSAEPAPEEDALLEERQAACSWLGSLTGELPVSNLAACSSSRSASTSA
jgi:hypothetical protein